MRGKKATAATNRRSLADLERRATEAERRANKLTAELKALEESSEQRIAGLLREVSALTKQREENASPLLDAAEDRIRALMAERDEALAKADGQTKRHELIFKSFRQYLMLSGLTYLESTEVIATATGVDIPSDFILITEETGVSGASSDRLAKVPGAAKRIQAARGHRGNEDLKSRLIAALNGEGGV